MEIRDVMTAAIVAAPPRASVRDIAEPMRDPDVGAVGLADPHERRVGLITDRGG